MLDPIEIALEAEAEGVRLLGSCPATGPDWTGGARRERLVELELAFLAPLRPSTDERLRVVCVGNRPDPDLHLLHGASVTPICDTNVARCTIR